MSTISFIENAPGHSIKKGDAGYNATLRSALMTFLFDQVAGK